MGWKAAMLQRVDADIEVWVDEIIQVASIPAPSHHEEERAEYVLKRLHDIGYPGAFVDETGNVQVDIDGKGEGTGPHVMLVAHLDTVFERDIHTPAHRDGQFLRGPSVADNSAGVAALITLATLMRDYSPTFPGRLTLAMSVGEEGLGNLKGIRALMDNPDRPDIVIALDGNVGRVVTKAIAGLRIEVDVTTIGGHSWGSFGNESAIRIGAACVSELFALSLPQEPKTTLNVGIFHGGIAINAIPGNANFTIELRSEEQNALDELRGRVEAVLDRYAEEIDGTLSYRIVGERPGGSLPAGHRLLDVIDQAHKQLGLETTFASSSTDANIPLSQGVAAVTLGVCRGTNTHRTDEYMEIDSIAPGIKQIILVLEALWNTYNSPSASLDRAL